MVISAFSPASIWANATRTLTGTGPAITVTSSPQASLAGSTAANLAATAGTCRDHSFSVSTPAAGGAQLGMYDGTNFYIDTTLGATAVSFRNQLLTQTINFRINNTTVNALTYMYCGLVYTQ